MSAKSKAPGTQEKRFAAYLERLASAAGHADRHEPLKSYCTGLLLPIKRKSVEPMAARLAPDNVRRMHQSLHHLVADAPWDDAALLAEVRQYALGAMEANGPIEAWIVDDTGFVKKGTHSVGVARQYCGQVGKPENCRVAVSLSVATAKSSLPVAWRLYLPETWAKDPERRSKAAIPEDVRFQTKPQIALEQIRQAVDDGIAPAPVLGDTAYGNNYKPLMGSWSPSGAVFPPLHLSSMLDYPSPNSPNTSNPAEPRIRPERHNPCSIATLRIRIARFLIQQLPRCPFCGPLRL